MLSSDSFRVQLEQRQTICLAGSRSSASDLALIRYRYFLHISVQYRRAKRGDSSLTRLTAIKKFRVCSSPASFPSLARARASARARARARLAFEIFVRNLPVELYI